MEIKTLKSPFTGSSNIELVKAYNPSLTSDGKIVDHRVENWLCLDTGITFNDSSIRGDEQRFYMDEYELSNESAEAEIMFFDKDKGQGMYDSITEFILSAQQIGSQGRILDVGCGKGLLLKTLKRHCASWSFSAIEPSRNAVSYFKKVMPELQVFEGMLEDSPFLNEKFDVIVSNGVLEHVPDPIRFLKTLREMLSDKGILYIGVPNFQNNPFDLFTTDHLSRFSSFNIRYLFENAGLKIEKSLTTDSRVPMWFILSATEIKIQKYPQLVVDQGKAIALGSVKIIEEFFKNYNLAAECSNRDGYPVAIYGTSGIGLIGTRYTSLTPHKIDRFFDDNHTLWGHHKLGIEICNPDQLKNSRAAHIVISASPCYVRKIYEKIHSMAPDKTVYVNGLI